MKLKIGYSLVFTLTFLVLLLLIFSLNCKNRPKYVKYVPPTEANAENSLGKAKNSTPAVGKSETDENAWVGEYIHKNEKAENLQILTVQLNDDKLTAVYRNIIFGRLAKQFILNGEIKDHTAFFYYDQCLQNAEEGIDGDKFYLCSKDDIKKGDLIFKLISSVGKNNEPVFELIPVNLKAMNVSYIINLVKIK